MSMSTHVIGFRPPDKIWKKHKAVWDVCEAAGVSIPHETLEFFNGEHPDDTGVEVDISACVQEFSSESQSGIEVDVDLLPAGIQILRFYNSW